MRILCSPYELEAKDGRKSRRGALLKVHFNEDLIGYADCHPWTELDDASLEKQLALLKLKQSTALTKKSLFFAGIDARARSEQVNLLDQLKIPPSNYLITDLNNFEIKGEGFKTYKVKLGSNLSRELAILKDCIPPDVHLRLDFNSKLDVNIFQSIVPQLKKLNIEYIEDPFPFDEKAWEEIQTNDGLNLAADFDHVKAVDKPFSAKMLILKPAVSDYLAPTNQKVVVTSYLDHPFGQCTAAYVAAKYPDTTCGLLTHHLYKQNAFSEQLSSHGPEFKKPEGFGFGFDEQLKKLKWVEL